MALVVPGYVPADGTVFNPTGWNTDMHSTTNGVSVYGELNGHLQDANFTAGQQMKPRHIRPFEAFRAEWGGQTDTTDWYEMLFGDSYDDRSWLTVPGASRRVWVPWASSCTVFQASAFGSALRMRQVSAPPGGQSPVDPVGPDIYIALFVDDVFQQATLRRLPYSYYPVVNPGTPNYFTAREMVLTHHWDFVVMSGAIGKGYHDVAIKVQVLQNTGVESIYAAYGGGDADQLCDHSVTHRLRLGIRAASIIAFP